MYSITYFSAKNVELLRIFYRITVQVTKKLLFCLSYRPHLIATLPHVKMIDFSAVTKQERELTSVWQRSRNPRKSIGHSKVD